MPGPDAPHAPRGSSCTVRQASCAPAPPDSLPTAKDEPERVRGIQYASREEARQALAQKPVPLLGGLAVGYDLCGTLMAAACPWGQYEASLRANLRGKYFPVVELGLGSSNHTDETTDLHYKTRAPYMRLGCDLNFARNKRGLGRIMGGVRGGFSSYKFDLDGPDLTDPVTAQSVPFSYHSVQGRTLWLELVLGFEAKVWSIVHVGWTARYRTILSDKDTGVGNAWYVPGYGKHSAHFGGTFALLFDI